MKKAILCPLLLAVASFSLNSAASADATLNESAPIETRPAETVIDLPSMIDPANVDDQKLSQMIDTLRASRKAAMQSLGDRTLLAGGVEAATTAGLMGAEKVTQSLVFKAKSSTHPRLASKLNFLERTGRNLRFLRIFSLEATVFAIAAGVYIKLDEKQQESALNSKESALMMQSGGNLDSLLKLNNEEIIREANKDANLKKHIVNIYQAIMFINEPAAN